MALGAVIYIFLEKLLNLSLLRNGIRYINGFINPLNVTAFSHRPLYVNISDYFIQSYA